MCISLLINKEVSMAMMSEETMKREAQYLLSKMSTFWGEYDFGETSEVADHRVPKLVFDADVKIMCDEVELVHYPHDKYIREVQLEYNGTTYIIAISSHIFCGVVNSYWIEVYTPAGDGKGGKKLVFGEKI